MPSFIHEWQENEHFDSTKKCKERKWASFLFFETGKVYLIERYDNG